MQISFVWIFGILKFNFGFNFLLECFWNFSWSKIILALESHWLRALKFCKNWQINSLLSILVYIQSSVSRYILDLEYIFRMLFFIKWYQFSYFISSTWFYKHSWVLNFINTILCLSATLKPKEPKILKGSLEKRTLLYSYCCLIYHQFQ